MRGRPGGTPAAEPAAGPPPAGAAGPGGRPARVDGARQRAQGGRGGRVTAPACRTLTAEVRDEPPVTVGPRPRPGDERVVDVTSELPAEKPADRSAPPHRARLRAVPGLG